MDAGGSDTSTDDDAVGGRGGGGGGGGKSGGDRPGGGGGGGGRRMRRPSAKRRRVGGGGGGGGIATAVPRERSTSRSRSRGAVRDRPSRREVVRERSEVEIVRRGGGALAPRRTTVRSVRGTGSRSRSRSSEERGGGGRYTLGGGGGVDGVGPGGPSNTGRRRDAVRPRDRASYPPYAAARGGAYRSGGDEDGDGDDVIVVEEERDTDYRDRPRRRGATRLEEERVEYRGGERDRRKLGRDR